MVIDELAEATEASSFRSKFSGEMARASWKDEDVVLLKPMTFMNLSGDCVQPCAAFFKVPAERIIIVHDELDVPFGELKLKLGGGHAGHNGLRSIKGRVKGDFGRLRVGIGRPPASFRGDVADYVLQDFTSDERDSLPKIVERARRSVLDIAARGFAAAMKQTNTRPKQKKSPPKAESTERPRDASDDA